MTTIRVGDCDPTPPPTVWQQLEWSGCYHWLWIEKLSFVWLILNLNLSMMTKINIADFWWFLSNKTLKSCPFLLHSHQWSPSCPTCSYLLPTKITTAMYPLINACAHLLAKTITWALGGWHHLMNQVLSMFGASWSENLESNNIKTQEYLTQSLIFILPVNFHFRYGNEGVVAFSH